jgi:hypothetical protein
MNGRGDPGAAARGAATRHVRSTRKHIAMKLKTFPDPNCGNGPVPSRTADSSALESPGIPAIPRRAAAA